MSPLAFSAEIEDAAALTGAVLGGRRDRSACFGEFAFACRDPQALVTSPVHKEGVVELADRSSPARARGGGLFTTISAVVLVVAVVAVAIAAYLLARTMAAALSINQKADVIAQTGRGINTATDSVVQLNRTNELARSILVSAEPLEDTVGKINQSAKTIDGLAVSVNRTAGTINGTAGDINATAGRINATAGTINRIAGTINNSAVTINQIAHGINAQAAAILDVAVRIDNDVTTINQNLDQTVGIAQAIKVDTGHIVGQALEARQTSGCIADKVYILVIPDVSGDC